MANPSGQVKFTYVPTGKSMPASPDSSTVYFLQATQEIYVGSLVFANFGATVSDLSEYQIKTVSITGSGSVVTNAEFNSETGALSLSLGNPAAMIAGTGINITSNIISIAPPAYLASAVSSDSSSPTTIVDTAVLSAMLLAAPIQIVNTVYTCLSRNGVSRVYQATGIDLSRVAVTTLNVTLNDALSPTSASAYTATVYAAAYSQGLGVNISGNTINLDSYPTINLSTSNNVTVSNSSMQQWVEAGLPLRVELDSNVGQYEIFYCDFSGTGTNGLERRYRCRLDQTSAYAYYETWYSVSYTRFSAVSRVSNVASTSAYGEIKLVDNTVQTVAATAVSSTADRTYAVQLNSNGQAVVNVPWSEGSQITYDVVSTVTGNESEITESSSSIEDLNESDPNPPTPYSGQTE